MRLKYGDDNKVIFKLFILRYAKKQYLLLKEKTKMFIKYTNKITKTKPNSTSHKT